MAQFDKHLLARLVNSLTTGQPVNLTFPFAKGTKFIVKSTVVVGLMAEDGSRLRWIIRLWDGSSWYWDGQPGGVLRQLGVA